MKIYYLACPYSHVDKSVRVGRFKSANVAAARLIERKLIVYSPISMTHPIDEVMAEEGATLGSDYWVDFDAAFMTFCYAMIILPLPGWELSSGIRRERAYFERLGRKVWMYDDFLRDAKPE